VISKPRVHEVGCTRAKSGPRSGPADDRSPRSTRSYEVVKFVAQSGDHFTPPRERGRGGRTGMSASAPIASNSSGRSPQGARFIDGCRSELTNNNGRWIVAPHEPDVSALSMNALVRGKPVPACYFSRRSLTKKSKKGRPVLRPRGCPSHPSPARGGGMGGGDGGFTSPGGRGPSAHGFCPVGLAGRPRDQLRP
jgi:hypothetical protein